MSGIIGQILILSSFVATGLACLAFYRATQYPSDPIDWKRIGRLSWGYMTGALIASQGILIYLLNTHQFQYAYVYQQSSLDLPGHFLVSASWAGQEGSFLLWLVMTGIVGLMLIKWAARSYEAPVMTIVGISQLFLLTMILGLKIGNFSIGASPFMMLAEKFPEAPVFQSDPNFVPADGTGLNDLLQNYWMVIHPPMLFIGFSTMVVPFAFALTALWKQRYTEWVRPALPWTLNSVMFLGIGIAMGGYWAYETLSFGGYWAWDPVENSSLVPWIVGVAAIHMMLIQKKSGYGHKGALFLSILSYLLVIYSTFLTRSGILGDVSVHSFVDLGLYNQLLLWILSIGGLGFGLFAYRYQELPRPQKEPYYLSREFMIFSGALILCAIAAVVLLGTSSPIFGKIFRNNPASVPIEFYNRWSLPLAVGFVFLGGLGQLFWWQKMTVETVNKALLKPIVLSVVSTLLVLMFTQFVEGSLNVPAPAAEAISQAGLFGTTLSVYGNGMLLLLLLFVSFFSLYGNGLVMWRIARGNPKLAGGALSHVGLAILILGIIASAGFSNPLSDGSVNDKTRAHFVIDKGQTRHIEGYTVQYLGQEPAERGRTRYVVSFSNEDGKAFTVKPVVYKSNKDQWIQHPDLKAYVEKDIFVAISPSLMFEQPGSAQVGEVTLSRGDSTTIANGTYQISFLNFNTDTTSLHQTVPESSEMAVAAVLKVTNLKTGETREVQPMYIIKEDRTVEHVKKQEADWDLTFTFTGMNVNTGQIRLQIEGKEIGPTDWVVVQAYEKPLISLVWIGIILITLGFCLSIFRRVQDYQAHRHLTPTA